MLVLLALVALLMFASIASVTGAIPAILLIGIVGIALRGIVVCIRVMIDSFASFFGITRDQSLVFHCCLIATILLPTLIVLWVIILLTFMGKVDRPSKTVFSFHRSQSLESV